MCRNALSAYICSRFDTQSRDNSYNDVASIRDVGIGLSPSGGAHFGPSFGRGIEFCGAASFCYPRVELLVYTHAKYITRNKPIHGPLLRKVSFCLFIHFTILHLRSLPESQYLLCHDEFQELGL